MKLENETRIQRTLLHNMLVAVAALFFSMASSPGSADELDGAWATNPDKCNEIFVKRGNDFILSERADFYGSGFVISGKTIKGKIAICKIQSMKKSGPTTNIRATCATDISVSTNSFGLRMDGDNKLIRSIPGVPELDTSYFRCFKL
jgi:hypothetical protein